MCNSIPFFILLMRKIFISVLFVLFFVSAHANDFIEIKIITTDSLICSSDSALVHVLLLPADSSKQKTSSLKKKFVSAVFAFPFPFGFMGAHRVMLGTKPWVPIIYAATFGGCFGLLPLIDFCVIVFSKDIEQYENNPKVFMWIK